MGVTRRTQLFKILICAFVISLGSITVQPDRALAGTDSYLGAAGNFQIVSGAAITLGGAITGLDTVNTSTVLLSSIRLLSVGQAEA